MRSRLSKFADDVKNSGSRIDGHYENLLRSNHRVAAQFGRVAQEIVQGGDVASAAIEGLGRATNLSLGALIALDVGARVFQKIYSDIHEADKATRTLHDDLQTITGDRAPDELANQFKRVSTEIENAIEKTHTLGALAGRFISAHIGPAIGIHNDIGAQQDATVRAGVEKAADLHGKQAEAERDLLDARKEAFEVSERQGGLDKNALDTKFKLAAIEEDRLEIQRRIGDALSAHTITRDEANKRLDKNDLAANARKTTAKDEGAQVDREINLKFGLQERATVYADQAANIKSKLLPAEEEQVELLQNQVALRKDIIETLKAHGASGEQIHKASIAQADAEAALARYEKERVFAHEQSLAAAIAETKELGLAATGQDHLAKLVKIEEQARSKIAQYNHANRADLAAQTEAQEKINRLAQKASRLQGGRESNQDFVRRGQDEFFNANDLARRINTTDAIEHDEQNRRQHGAYVHHPDSYDGVSSDLPQRDQAPSSPDAYRGPGHSTFSKRDKDFVDFFHPRRSNPFADHISATRPTPGGGTPGMTDHGSAGEAKALVSQLKELVTSINGVADKLKIA
jgi:hypothetical protein